MSCFAVLFVLFFLLFIIMNNLYFFFFFLIYNKFLITYQKKKTSSDVSKLIFNPDTISNHDKIRCKNNIWSISASHVTNVSSAKRRCVTCKWSPVEVLTKSRQSIFCHCLIHHFAACLHNNNKQQWRHVRGVGADKLCWKLVLSRGFEVFITLYLLLSLIFLGKWCGNRRFLLE